MFKKLLPLIKSWLPLAFAITIIIGTIYASVQQNYRQNANDPQIQMVEDIIDALNNGLQPSNLNSPVHLDMSKTLSPFMTLYSETGTPVVSSGYLNDQIATLPAGVLDYTKTHGQSRLTWQPRPDVRVAAIIEYYQIPASEQAPAQSGFILAGRSLRSIETNINQLTWLILLGWLVALLGSLLIMIGLEWPKLKTTPSALEATIETPEEPNLS